MHQLWYKLGTDMVFDLLFSQNRFILFVINLFLIFNSFQFAQYKDTANYKISRLETIYNNLEYNTTAFNDLKRNWVVTDPVFIREIFNKFIVKNALRYEGNKPSLELLKEKAKDIYDGNVFISLRKRYYDDEIEMLRFFTESRIIAQDTTDYFFDSINDYVYLKDILGEKLYKDLQAQFYAFNDLTKTYFDTKQSYNFDIYLHLLEPELMFWTYTSDQKNKYLVSMIGKWGNNNITIPGWNYPSYVVGLKLTYMDYLVNNRPNNTYIFELGTGFPARQPIFGFEGDEYGRRLFYTGSNMYFRIVGNPLEIFWEDLYDFELDLSGLFSLAKLQTKDFGFSYLTKFYSTRNYLTFSVKKKDLLSFSDIGALSVSLGYSTFDVHYFLFNPLKTQLEKINAKDEIGFKSNIFTEIGIHGDGGLLNHRVKTQISYNFTDQRGYLGIMMYFMLSNSIGLDFSFFTSYNVTNNSQPFYQGENYIVFSPVIRINY